MNSMAGATCTSPPTLDLTYATGLGIRGFIGDLILTNKIGLGHCKVQLEGNLIINPSCTKGSITVYGDAYVSDHLGNPYVNGVGKTELIDRTTGTPEEIAENVFTKFETTDI